MKTDNSSERASLTHPSYAAAQSDLKKHKAAAGLCRWDAGDGHVAEAYYCTWRKRVVSTLVMSNGYRVL